MSTAPSSCSGKQKYSKFGQAFINYGSYHYDTMYFIFNYFQ